MSPKVGSSRIRSSARAVLGSRTSPRFSLSLLAALHVVFLEIGNTGPAIGGHLSTPGEWRLGFFHGRLGTRHDTLVHILLDILAGHFKAGTDRGVVSLG